MGWQPIETAPRDGTWFMGWDGDQVQPFCWIAHDPDDCDPYEGWAYADCRWGGVLYEGFNEAKAPPILWQKPLPPPPETD